ncbi:MAG TPA: alpha/beta hydrolase [Anaerolineae bacterium]|nr:alpha/beta hydrolase [Anaerolineae bacterium]
MTQAIIYLHGFTSSAHATKAQFLTQKFNNNPLYQFHPLPLTPTPRDFEYMTISGNINRLRHYITTHNHQNPILIGSSMGGLAALNYAHRFPHIQHLILLAPVLSLPTNNPIYQQFFNNKETATPIMHHGFNQTLTLQHHFLHDGQLYQTPPAPTAPITIIHGRQDPIVPFAASQSYAHQHPNQVTLHPIDATHDINDHLPFIWQTLQTLL